MRKIVSVTASQLEVMEKEMKARFASAGGQLELHIPSLQGFSSREMIEIARNSAILIAGDDQLDEKFFSQCARLKLVIRWGAGTDSVDIHAANVHGVRVVNTPGILGTAVAEYTLGLLLLLARRLHEVNTAVQAGDWLKPRGTTLRGKILGVIGYGNVGQSIGRLCHDLGMRILWFDPGVVSSKTVVGQNSSVHQIAKESDFLVLACPLNNSTRGLVNREFLSRMKLSANLVNVARGEIVDEDALVVALSERTIAGAALDVFCAEPLPQDHPLRGVPNVFFGSHNASNTHESVLAVNEKAIQLATEGLAKTLFGSE